MNLERKDGTIVSLSRKGFVKKVKSFFRKISNKILNKISKMGKWASEKLEVRHLENDYEDERVQ